MDQVFKILLPIILAIHLGWFNKKFKEVQFIPTLLIYGLLALSSNYYFPFAQTLYRLIQILAIINLIDLFFKKQIHTHTNNANFFLIILFFILISSFQALNKEIFLASLINYLTCALVSMYLFTVFKNQKKFELFLKYILQISFLLALATFINYIVNPERVELSAFNPNYLAFFLSMGFAISLFLREKNQFVITAILFLAIFMTGSRSMLVAAGLLLCFKIFRNSKWGLYFVVLLLIIFEVFPNFYLQSGLGRFGQSADNTGDFERIAIFQASKQIFSEKPLTGVGYGEFSTTFSNYVPVAYSAQMSRDKIVTHSDYLKMLVETGVLSCLFFSAATIFQLVQGYKLSKKGHEFLLGLCLVATVFSLSHDNINSFISFYLILLPAWFNLKFLKAHKVV